jgi:hypothetical protein
MIIILLALAITALYLISRKHIRIVDERTGKEIEKQRIEFKPRTRIDLTDAFENASNDAVRVQFMKPAIKKLSGFRIVFLYENAVAGEINQYNGELEHIVRLPAAPPVQLTDEENVKKPTNEPNQKMDDPDRLPPKQ